MNYLNIHVIVTFFSIKYIFHFLFQEEVQKLASQIEFMKIVHMEVNNRHLKPKHGGFFSQSTSNQSPVIKNIYMKFESTDSPGSRISPAAELVSEKVWIKTALNLYPLPFSNRPKIVLKLEIKIWGLWTPWLGPCKKNDECYEIRDQISVDDGLFYTFGRIAKKVAKQSAWNKQENRLVFKLFGLIFSFPVIACNFESNEMIS